MARGSGRAPARHHAGVREEGREGGERTNAKEDRIAGPWLIRRFVDPEAEFLYVPADEVTSVAQQYGAIPFDVQGAELGHVAGRCSFESIVLKYRLSDPALQVMGRIVHGADIPQDIAIEPEAAGLRAIAEGFSMTFGERDQEKLAAELPLYDALYAWCATRARAGS